MENQPQGIPKGLGTQALLSQVVVFFSPGPSLLPGQAVQLLT